MSRELPKPAFFVRSSDKGKGLRIPVEAAGAAEAVEKARQLAKTEGRAFVLFSETKLADVQP